MKALNFVNRIGLFRLVLTPLAAWIIYTAFERDDITMGVVGAVILVFGLLNWCLIGGKCKI
ncbi:MAG: hypothetical protein KA163_13755 [Bacteroidia bacterium]|nr:hypothetical protein [Bacteroidia bacterium]